MAEGTQYFVQVYCNGIPEGRVQTTEDCSYEVQAAPSKQYYFMIWAKNNNGMEGPRSRTSMIETGKFLLI